MVAANSVVTGSSGAAPSTTVTTTGAVAAPSVELTALGGTVTGSSDPQETPMRRTGMAITERRLARIASTIPDWVMHPRRATSHTIVAR